MMFNRFIDAIKLTIKMADEEKPIFVKRSERKTQACDKPVRTNYTHYISLNK